MPVLPVQAIGEFVGMGLADHPRAGIEQALHRDRRPIGHGMGFEPHRIAEAAAVSGDVIEVLDAERSPAERPCGRTFHSDMRVPAERTQRIARQNVIGRAHGRRVPPASSRSSSGRA